MATKDYEFTFDAREASKELIMGGIDNLGEQIFANAKNAQNLQQLIGRYGVGAGLKSVGYIGPVIKISLSVEEGASGEQLAGEITGALVGMACGVLMGAACTFFLAPAVAIGVGVFASAAVSYYGGQAGETLGRNAYGFIKELIDPPKDDPPSAFSTPANTTQV